MSEDLDTVLVSPKEAQAMVEAKGFKVTKVMEFRHGIPYIGTVVCYVVHTEGNEQGFIIRSDNGELLPSYVFWKNYSSSRLARDGRIILNDSEE